MKNRRGLWLAPTLSLLSLLACDSGGQSEDHAAAFVGSYLYQPGSGISWICDDGFTSSDDLNGKSFALVPGATTNADLEQRMFDGCIVGFDVDGHTATGRAMSCPFTDGSSGTTTYTAYRYTIADGVVTVSGTYTNDNAGNACTVTLQATAINTSI